MLITKLTIGIALTILPALCSANSVDEYLSDARNLAHIAVEYDSGSRPPHWVSSWIEDAQLRVQLEEDEKNESSETYRLRIQPVLGAAYTAARSAQQANTQKIALRTERAVSTELSSRYLKLIELQEVLARIRHLSDKQTLLRTEIDTERSLSRTSDFNAARLQRLVVDLNQVIDQIKLYHRRFKHEIDALQITLTDRGNGISDWLISPEDVLAEAEREKVRLQNPEVTPVVQLAQMDKNIASSKLLASQAKQSLGINFLELKYKDTENSSTGVTIGFRIPIGGVSKTYSRKVEKLNADSKYFQTASSTQASIQEILSSIDWDYMSWISTRKTLDKLEQLMAQPERAQNPELITGLRRQQLSLRNELVSSHMSLLKNYIKLLDLSGSLSQEPLRNWLHTDLSLLAEQ